MDARTPVIIDAIRTPIGKYGGVLKDVRPDDLAAHVIRTIAARTNIDTATIDEVIFGCANQAGAANRISPAWLHCWQDCPKRCPP